MKTWDEKERRLECVLRIRAEVETLLGAIGTDPVGSTYEDSLARATASALRDWSARLEGEITHDITKAARVSSADDRIVRFGAKLDKIEALFEKLVEQGAVHATSRNRFERTALAQLESLQNAVMLLLSRDPPSMADKIEAAKAIRDSANPQPKTGAQS